MDEQGWGAARWKWFQCTVRASEPSSETGLARTPAQSRGGRQRDRRKRKETRRGAVGDGSTYCIERALPVVGDVGLAFRRFLEDPFVTFIRGHLSHQPAGERRG